MSTTPTGAGETVSVRVPANVRAELKAATGLAFSTFVRLVASAVLEYYRRERKAKEGARVLREGRDAVAAVTEELLAKGGEQ